MNRGSASALLVILAAVQPARADEVPQLIARVMAGPSVDADRAAQRLSYLGADRAGPSLRALLASPDPHARLAGSSALVIVRDPRAASMLQHILEDEDWETRRNAATALGGIKARSATPALEKRLRTDPKDKVRMACVKALLAIDAGGNGLAAASVSDASFEVRLAALDALTHLKDRSSHTRIRPLLKDDSELIRFTAARTLAWQNDTAGRQFIEKSFASSDADQARRALTVATDVPASWVMSLFEKGLSHPDPAVRCAAAVALAKRKDIRGRRYLARVEREDTPESAIARRTLDDLGVMPDDRERLAAEPQ